MRDYAKVAPQFWIGETGRELRTLGPETQVLALYLITSPHSNMLGLYYLPLPLMAHETGLPLQGTLKALARLSEVHFAHYDAPSEMIWIPEMARYQIGEALKKDDNRVRGINKDYQALPNNPFLKDFYDKYHEVYHLTEARVFKAPSKPLRSQEQEQEQDLEQEQEQERGVFSQPAPAHAQDIENGLEARKTPSPARAGEDPLCVQDTVTAYTFPTTPPCYTAPVDFQPSAALWAQAEEDAPHVDLDNATKRFKTTCFKTSVLDWALRWHKFVLEDEDRLRHRNGQRRLPQNSQDDLMAAMIALEEQQRGTE